MIYLYLSGGLGNQMFQYAFARSLQEQTGQEITLCLNHFKNQNVNAYSLNCFDLDKKCRILESESFHYFAAKIRRRLHSLFNKGNKNNTVVLKRSIVNFGSAFEDVSNYKFSSNIVVDGHYQSEKWFANCKEIIKNEFSFNSKPTKKNNDISEKIKATNSVCLHIRRGDYLTPRWQHLNVCGYDYFKRSMEYISKNVDNPVFYVFSDNHEEIEWIKENYDFSGYNLEYVDLDNTDYEELYLMHCCKHFIISNSTFSWWAQYLSESQNKIVCAPSVWNKRKGIDCENIYLDKWKII